MIGFGDVLGDGFLSGLTPSAGPSQAFGGTLGGSMFDNSGWNVNFDGGSITSTGKPDQVQKYLPYVVIGVIGLVAWRAFKSSK